MDSSTRPVEWLAISLVVAGGLWAGVYLAPAGGDGVKPVSQAFPARADSDPGPATLQEGSLSAAPGGDRVMVVPERAPVSAAAAVAQPAAAPVAAAARRFSPPHLQRLPSIVDPEQEAHTSAFMASAPAAEEAGADAPNVGAQPTVASRGDAAPVTVHYGVVDRASLMGRGAGPVYNFKSSGSSRGSGQ